MRLQCGLVDEYSTQREWPQLCARSHRGLWRLAMCTTALLSHALACNGCSAALAQPTPLAEIDAFRMGGWVTFGQYFGWGGQFPATPVGLEKLEISSLSLFRMVFRYWQTSISFCRNTRIWQTDRHIQTGRRTDRILWQQYRALYYMQSHGKN